MHKQYYWQSQYLRISCICLNVVTWSTPQLWIACSALLCYEVNHAIIRSDVYASAATRATMLTAANLPANRVARPHTSDGIAG
jgi:hypothetical protein